LDKFFRIVCVGGNLEGILSRICLCVSSIIWTLAGISNVVLRFEVAIMLVLSTPVYFQCL